MAGSAHSAVITPQTIDYGEVSGIPTTTVDNLGVQHLLWSKVTEVMYSNSADNFNNLLPFGYVHGTRDFSNLAMTFDNNGNVHVAYNVYSISKEKWETHYTNSTDWNARFLEMGNSTENVDVKALSDGRVVVVGQRPTGSQGMNLVLATSVPSPEGWWYPPANYDTFDYRELNQSADQSNPRMVIDSKDNIHLAYRDWSDGNGKVKYRSSLDDFASEETISSAPQSYGHDMALDSNGNVWVSYKDTRNIIDGSDSSQSADIFLADKESGWSSTRVTSLPISFKELRDTALTIDSFDNKIVAWDQLSDDKSSVGVYYASTGNSLLKTFVDSSTNTNLGYLDIGSYGSTIYLAANLHSLVNYSIVVPEPSAALPVMLGAGAAMMRRRKYR